MRVAHLYNTDSNVVGIVRKKQANQHIKYSLELKFDETSVRLRLTHRVTPG